MHYFMVTNKKSNVSHQHSKVRFLIKKMLQYTILGTAFLWIGCTADKVAAPQISGSCPTPQPTYDGSVKEIIDRTCAYSGCHLDSAPGRYDSYTNLVGILEGGKFKTRVIDLKDDPISGMPPNNAPQGKAVDLTEEELNIIQCWLDANYPEN